MKNTWYDLDEEVHREREVVRTHRTLPRVSTYKAQAKREMALRLELEERVKELEQRVDAYMDLTDGLSAGDFARANGMGLAFCEATLRRAQVTPDSHNP